MTDIELPLIECVFQNIRGLARVFISNAFFNGLALITFIIVYIVNISDSKSGGFIHTD